MRYECINAVQLGIADEGEWHLGALFIHEQSIGAKVGKMGFLGCIPECRDRACSNALPPTF
jgi:hypothetical protein